MKPKVKKPAKPALAVGTKRLGIAETQSAAAAAMGVTVKTIRAWKVEGSIAAGFRPDGTVDLDKLQVWQAARRVKRTGSIDAKETKTHEEIRKLRLANDAREGRLIERAWMAEKIQRCAGDLNQFRAKSEAEHPLRFAAAAGDVAACREVLRVIWDEIFSYHQGLSKHFEETPAK